jgi:hypothetical protein
MSWPGASATTEALAEAAFLSRVSQRFAWIQPHGAAQRDLHHQESEEERADQCDREDD